MWEASRTLMMAMLRKELFSLKKMLFLLAIDCVAKRVKDARNSAKWSEYLNQALCSFLTNALTKQLCFGSKYVNLNDLLLLFLSGAAGVERLALFQCVSAHLQKQWQMSTRRLGSVARQKAIPKTRITTLCKILLEWLRKKYN